MKFTANDFTTEFPAEWEDRTMITLFAPFAPGSFAPNAVITKHRVEASENLEDFVREQLRLLRESLPNYELLDQRQAVVNDFPAYQTLHRFQSEQETLQQVQTFLLANSLVFVITGTAPVREFDQHIAAFRQIVENFQIAEN